MKTKVHAQHERQPEHHKLNAEEHIRIFKRGPVKTCPFVGIIMYY